MAFNSKGHRPSLTHLALILLAVALSGCAQKLPTDYGERSGTGSGSVNGTAVLADLFKQAGHTVSSRRSLSPKLNDRGDVIVWFPDDLNPPSKEVRAWLESWLLWNAPNRTLIYVGRDYDAEANYWRGVRNGAPAEIAPEIDSRVAGAEAGFLVDRQSISLDTDNPWFTLEGRWNHRDVRTLAGDPTWLAGVDPAKLEIELNGRLRPPPTPAPVTRKFVPDNDSVQPSTELQKSSDTLSVPEDSDRMDEVLIPDEFPPVDMPFNEHLGENFDSPSQYDFIHEPTEVLLESEGDPLVMRQPFGDSQLLVVTNGSFLLNEALVNHEHRKLAARLVEAVGPEKKRVIFLESRDRDPTILDKDSNQMDTGFKLFAVWPFNYVFVHLAALGVIYCYFRWPILGVPRDPRTTQLGNFREHIVAVGTLLEHSGDQTYATNRLAEYQAGLRHSASGPAGTQQNPPAGPRTNT